MNGNESSMAENHLREALEALKERGRVYDSSGDGRERSMQNATIAFNVITGSDLQPEEGWLFMAILKAVRSQQGEYHGDNYTDGAAYFALAGEQAQKDRISKTIKDCR